MHKYFFGVLSIIEWFSALVNRGQGLGKNAIAISGNGVKKTFVRNARVPLQLQEVFGFLHQMLLCCLFETL